MIFAYSGERKSKIDMRAIIAHFLPFLQFFGFSGSLGPSQSTYALKLLDPPALFSREMLTTHFPLCKFQLLGLSLIDSQSSTDLPGSALRKTVHSFRAYRLCCALVGECWQVLNKRLHAATIEICKTEKRLGIEEERNHCALGCSWGQKLNWVKHNAWLTVTDPSKAGDSELQCNAETGARYSIDVLLKGVPRLGQRTIYTSR